MRVIFLDIDGVLNKHNKLTNGYYGFVPECVDRLNAILDTNKDIHLVISSAWRYMMPDAMTLKGFEYLLITSSINCEHRLFGYTEKDEVIPSRGNQINQFLKDHPEIDSFVILDDRMFDFPSHPHLSARWIQTDGLVGLTDEHVQRVLEFFK